MRKKLLLVVIVLLLAGLLLSSGCIPGDGSHSNGRPAGFFWGVWHGWIAPVSLIIGLFNKNIRVYEMANAGWRYDFGFYIAIISGFGGFSFFRKK